MDRAVKASHQLVEGPRIATAGATRKVKLFSMAGLYGPTLLAVHRESTGDARYLFLEARARASTEADGLHATGCCAPRGGPFFSSNDCAKASSLASGSSRSMCSPNGWRTLYGVV